MSSLRLTLLLGITLISGLSVLIILPAFELIASDFNMDKVWVQLSTSSFMVIFGGAALISDFLANQFGIRKSMIAGMVLFIFGCYLCCTSSNYPLFLLGRWLQALGCASPSALCYVLVKKMYNREQQPGVFAYINGMYTLSLAASPVIGSYIINLWGWESSFLIIAILGTINLGLCCFCLNEFHEACDDLQVTSSFSFPSSHLFWIFVFSIVLCTAPYWIYISLSQNLYVNLLASDLEAFGIFQGSVAFAFIGTSFISGFLIKLFSAFQIFRACLLIYITASISLFLFGLNGETSTTLLTTLIFFIAGSSAPLLTILYTESLNLFPSHCGRIAALSRCMRLIFIASLMEFTLSFFKENILMNVMIIVSASVLFMLVIHLVLRAGDLQIASLPKA